MHSGDVLLYLITAKNAPKVLPIVPKFNIESLIFYFPILAKI